MRLRPGRAARVLLGGDDAVHVFPTQRAALAYAMRMPGALTLAPTPKRKHDGWQALLKECVELPPRRLVHDRHVVIELEQDADVATKQLVRQLGHALYRAGALEVRCWNRIVAKPPEQRSFW